MAWVIDPAHTLVEFSVKHMMIATVRGRFTAFSGTLEINDSDPTKSRAEGTVELASIDTHDPNRDAHLRAADFFEVDKYPTMTFRSTRIEPAGDGRFKVIGDLTIKGTTKEATFDVTDEGQGKDPWGGNRRGFSATATINRKDWGLVWNVGLESGGVLVGDQVKIAMEVEVVERVEVGATA